MGVVSRMWGWKELLNVLLLSFVIALISLGQYVDAGPPRRAPEKIQVQIDDSVNFDQKENQIQNDVRDTGFKEHPFHDAEMHFLADSQNSNYVYPSSEPYAEPHSEPEPYAEPHSEPEPYAEPYSEPETITYAKPHPESETIDTEPYADPHTGFRKHPFQEAEMQFLEDSQNSNYVYPSSEPYAEPHHEPEPDEGEAVVESENEQSCGAPTMPSSSESRAGAKVLPILVKLQNKYQNMNDVDKRKLIEKADVYREKFKATIDKIDDETAMKYGLDKKIINTILGLDDSSNIYVPLHSEPVPEPIPEHQPEPEPTYVPEYKVKAYSEPSQYNPNMHGHYNMEKQHGGYKAPNVQHIGDEGRYSEPSQYNPNMHGHYNMEKQNGGYKEPNVQHIGDEGRYKDDRKVEAAKPGDVKSDYDHLIANKAGPVPIYSIKSGYVHLKKNTGKKSNHQMDYRKNAHISAHKQRPHHHQYPPGYFNDPRMAEMAMKQHNHFHDFDEFSMYNDDYDLSDYLDVPPSLYSPYQQRQAHHHRQPQRGYGNRGRPRQQTGYPHRGGWM